jgi:hypothetical protein
VRESYCDANPYPTVLIIGTKQYLNPIYKQLKQKFANVYYNPTSAPDYTYYDAYKLLRSDQESNLGWRILSELFLDSNQLKNIIEKSYENEPIINLLEDDFVESHKSIIDTINTLDIEDENHGEILRDLMNKLGEHFDSFIECFKEQNTSEEADLIDSDEPYILLTSYQGCKGISGGHIFIVGAVNGVMPKIQDDIDDIELSKFIVAMTRTRKCCYILSNKWQYAPSGGSFEPSIFLDYLPSEYIEDRGYLKAGDISE